MLHIRVRCMPTVKTRTSTDYLDTLTRLSVLAPSMTLILPSHSGDTMPPEMIPAMRDALVAVMKGRVAERSMRRKRPTTLKDSRSMRRWS